MHAFFLGFNRWHSTHSPNFLKLLCFEFIFKYACFDVHCLSVFFILLHTEQVIIIPIPLFPNVVPEKNIVWFHFGFKKKVLRECSFENCT